MSEEVKAHPKVTIVMPVFNEGPVVGEVIARVRALYPDFEVLVVDDGSTDDSAEKASAAGARVVRHVYNRGNGAAVKTGIRNARGDILVLMDGDGQHDPHEIAKLLEPMDEYDMVVGARDFKRSGARHRSWANVMYNDLATYLTEHRVEDLTSGFRAVRRRLALAFAYLLPNTFSYPSTITLAMFRAGYGVKYVPINVRTRVGKSKIRIVRDGVRFLAIMTKIIMIFSPMKVFFPLGMLCLAPSLTYTVYRVVFEGARISNPMVLGLSVSVLIFVLGLISEQIALLRMERIDEPQRDEESGPR